MTDESKPDSATEISLGDLIDRKSNTWLYDLVVGSMLETYDRYGFTKDKPVRLELRINGQPASLRRWFDSLENKYAEAVKAEARKMVEMKLQGLVNKIERIQRMVDHELEE